ncbi:MAG: pyridoxamine 5'-phosphate oxidase family protein [Thermoleophilia bacterium]|nr:pyridoxamine 5'-phosphate oxidase family protein [Thermoleophilia bacterium]
MQLPDTAKAVLTAGHLAHHRVRHIRRDPRVSLSMEADGHRMGMRNHLVVEGEARITPGGAPALPREPARRYVGPGTVFPPMPDPPEGFIIRVTATRVRGMGPRGTTL